MQLSTRQINVLTGRALQNYPDGADKVVGFVDWQLIKALQWDHIYSANYFLALMALLAASLAACTSTRQWPMVKVARRCALHHV
jgi:cytochrome c biogenesis protein